MKPLTRCPIALWRKSWNVRAKFKVASYETYLDRGEEVRKVKFNV